MTNKVYNCLKLIHTVNENYHYLGELEELYKLFKIASTSDYYKEEIKEEYSSLKKICFYALWSHEAERKKEWEVKNILKKLEDKTREEIENIDLQEIIPKENTK